MRNTLLTAFLAAAIVAGVMHANRAEAMTLAAPSALNAAAADASLVQHVTAVCGSNGCVPVQTSRPRKKIYPLGMAKPH